MKSRTKFLLGGVGAVTLLLIGGVVWAGFQIADQLGAPGIPPATGSGSCTSADAVNVQLVWADGHTVQACTHDQPACHNTNLNLDNQLRSASRRYIFQIQTEVAVAAATSGQTFQLGGWTPLPKGPQVSEPLQPPAVGRALLSVTPRDPLEMGFTAGSGTLTLTSGGGLVRGVIDGTFPTEFRGGPTAALWRPVARDHHRPFHV